MLPRTHWSQLFIADVHTPTPGLREYILPTDVLKIVLLYTDPVAIQYWAEIYPFIQAMENDSDYQKTWLQYYTNHTHLTYTQIINYDLPQAILTKGDEMYWPAIPEDGDLRYFGDLTYLLQCRLDKLALTYIEENMLVYKHFSVFDDIVEDLVKYMRDLESYHILIDLVEYMSIESKTLVANSIFCMLACLPYRLNAGILTRIYTTFSAYADASKFEGTYKFYLALATDTYTVDIEIPIAYARYFHNMACVYDNVLLYEQLNLTKHNLITYQRATGYNASKILHQLYSHPPTVNPCDFVHPELSWNDILHLTQHLTLAMLRKAHDVELMRRLYKSRTWTDIAIQEAVYLLCVKRYSQMGYEVLKVMRDDIDISKLDRHLINDYFQLVSIIYGDMTYARRMIICCKRDHEPFHELITSNYSIITTEDESIVKNKGYYLLIHRFIQEHTCTDIDASLMYNSYVFVPPHSSIIIPNFGYCFQVFGVKDIETLKRAIA